MLSLCYIWLVDLLYRANGFADFDRVALITNGNWYYDSALIAMGGHQTFRCRLLNIGLNHKL